MSFLFDLVVLVPDSNMEFAVRQILTRKESLGIRKVEHEIFRHVERDPGCLVDAHNFLRPLQAKYSRALVMLDREGCGREHFSRTDLEAEIESRLEQSGWGRRSGAIVIDPELEAWVWSDSPHVSEHLGWKDREPDLRTWLTEKGYLGEAASKPERPKEAVEEALRIVRKPRSSSLYRDLAQDVGFRRCSDAAFQKLQNLLRQWFSVE